MNVRGDGLFALGWLVVIVVAGCPGGDHHHDHDQDHEGKGKDKGSEHSQEHPAEHDHHEAGHGHGDEPMFRITRWSQRLELFAEHPAAVVGQELRLLAHLTVLDGFTALEQGKLSLELSGPEALSASTDKPLRPGIFVLSLRPRKAGTYRGELRVEGLPGRAEGTTSDRLTNIELQVYPDEASARKAVPPEQDDPFIDFLKEQQWKVPFSTVFVATGSIQSTVEVQGSVDTPPGGSAQVGAPIAGRVLAPPGGLPRPGEQVKKGQLLASLAPTPASPEAAARAKLAVVEAQARQAAAEATVGRAERLMADQAVSRRELEDARREKQVADQAVVAARRADALFTGAKSGRGTGSWRLTSPLAGTMVQVDARPGSTVAPGDDLFSIVDTSELWIRARVPEQQAARLDTSGNPVYRIAGLSEWRQLIISGDDATASLVAVSPVVDPRTRTVDVIYALRSPDPRLRVGGLLSVGLPTGEVWQGVVIPAAAVIDDGGRSLVYVQVDGEHFEERAVRTGTRSGNDVGISSGLEKGERIVVQGANIVRLSSRASSGQAHGHIH